MAPRVEQSAGPSAAIGFEHRGNFRCKFFLILADRGVTSGILATWGERAEGVGADIMVQPPNSSVFFAFSTPSCRNRLPAKSPRSGVDESAPVLIVVDTANLGVIYGIDEPRFEGLSKGFRFISGTDWEKPDDAIADDLAAARGICTSATT